MGFIFRRKVKETYYVCNSYRRVFLLSWNTAAMVLYKHVHASRISTSRVIQLYTASICIRACCILCTDVRHTYYYIMSTQYRRLMFSLLSSLRPWVKFAEIRKCFFRPFIWRRGVGRACGHDIGSDDGNECARTPNKSKQITSAYI
jgi:hypothetical protein